MKGNRLGVPALNRKIISEHEKCREPKAPGTVTANAKQQPPKT